MPCFSILNYRNYLLWTKLEEKESGTSRLVDAKHKKFVGFKYFTRSFKKRKKGILFSQQHLWKTEEVHQLLQFQLKSMTKRKSDCWRQKVNFLKCSRISLSSDRRIMASTSSFHQGGSIPTKHALICCWKR